MTTSEILIQIFIIVSIGGWVLRDSIRRMEKSKAISRELARKDKSND